jgi:hypothetical protein
VTRVGELAAQAEVIRPHLFVLGRDFNDLYVELEALLLQAESGSGEQASLFRHGPDLVIAGDGRLQVLDQPMFIKELAARLQFSKQVQEGQDNWVIRPADPPGGVIASMFSARSMLELPKVDRVAHTPFFGPDGVLQRTPGYHAGAKVLYVPGPGLVIPPVSTNPTPSEVDAALKLINEELLGDFRFAHPGDKAGALAAGLTPYAHPTIGGPTPIMGFDAPASRSGKGLLQEALLAPACGQAWTTTPAPTRTEEWHKQIVAALRPGPLVAAFDNVNNKINSGALASAVTAWPAITSRMLGFSANVRMPLPAVWSVTGNNLRASTEIANRINRIRIDAQSESPGHRSGPEPGTTWRHDNLRGWFTEHRGEIIHAWLTIIQAWITAGRPMAKVPAFGSFEQWTQVIGSILAFHGNHDLLTNRDEAADTMDDDQESWHAFMAWWAENWDLEQTPADLVDMATAGNSPHCPANLTSMALQGRVTAMGAGLTELRGQRFGRYTLQTKRKSSGRVWYLQPVE